MPTSKSTTCCNGCRWITVAIILSVLSLVLGGLAYYKASKGQDDKGFNARVEKGIDEWVKKKQAEQAGPPAPTEPVDVSIDDDPMEGDKKAPVTIVEFSDFECPFCGRFVQGTYPQIVSEYIDKGKVRLVFRDFPLGFHQFAKTAALAANCAREQGGDEMYFKYHDKVFGNQQELSVENLKEWAKDLGVDASKFNSCLDSKKYEAEVDNDYNQGQTYGVSGTPAFFINGRLLSGAQPFSAFKTLIDEELAKVGK